MTDRKELDDLITTNNQICAWLSHANKVLAVGGDPTPIVYVNTMFPGDMPENFSDIMAGASAINTYVQSVMKLAFHTVIDEMQQAYAEKITKLAAELGVSVQRPH